MQQIKFYISGNADGERRARAEDRKSNQETSVLWALVNWAQDCAE